MKNRVLDHRQKITHTDHPHIVKAEGVCSGRPIIEGTRLDVWVIASYYKMGMGPEAFLAQWDYVTPAQYFDALAYYFDHKEEIEGYIEANQKAYEDHRKAEDVRAEAVPE